MLRREWILVTFICAFTGGYLSGLAVAALTVPAMVNYLRGPRRLDPMSFVALRILDDAAYGLGVVASCVRYRTLRPVAPDLRSWRANVS